MHAISLRVCVCVCIYIYIYMKVRCVKVLRPPSGTFEAKRNTKRCSELDEHHDEHKLPFNCFDVALFRLTNDASLSRLYIEYGFSEQRNHITVRIMS